MYAVLESLGIDHVGSHVLDALQYDWREGDLCHFVRSAQLSIWPHGQVLSFHLSGNTCH